MIDAGVLVWYMAVPREEHGHTSMLLQMDSATRDLQAPVVYYCKAYLYYRQREVI